MIDGPCEVQLEGCSGRATGRHHRLLRRHRGSDAPENLVAVCAECHTASPAAIHRNVAWAYSVGLLIHSYDGPPTERWNRSRLAAGEPFMHTEHATAPDWWETP